MSLPLPVLEYDDPTVNKEYVERRLADWYARVEHLYESIRKWASSIGWQAELGDAVSQQEELADRFAIRTRPLKALNVSNNDGSSITVKPKGLWVIGANGRIDLYAPKGVYLLIDVADIFSPAAWVMYRVGQREPHKFVPDLLKDMI